MVKFLTTRTFLPVLLLFAGSALAWQLNVFNTAPTNPIRIAVLHSTTGTMAASETPIIQAVEMAVKEINDEGGLLNRNIETIIVNPDSDPKTYAAMAESLLVHEKVDAIFGCWTSSSRKHVRTVVEKYDSILFYPVQHEGLEASANIVYTGSTPNQQILPAITWAKENLGSRFYIVGSDYVFPRVASVIIRDHLTFLGAELVGESYVLPGDNQVSSIVAAIKTTQPDVIINTLNGSTNHAFFKGLRAAGISAQSIPTISFSMSENELSLFTDETIVGDYLAWHYFQSVDTAENRVFIKRFKGLYGDGETVSSPMISAYSGVRIWASAVLAAGSATASDVRAYLPDNSTDSPGGLVYLDKSNHAWLPALVGRISPGKAIDIVWQSDSPIQPIPFPAGKNRQEWEFVLNGLNMQWNGNWQNTLWSEDLK